MTKIKPIYYWDSSIFIAWIKDEKRPPGEMDGVAEIAEEIHRNDAVLLTSMVFDVEFLECKMIFPRKSGHNEELVLA